MPFFKMNTGPLRGVKQHFAVMSDNPIVEILENYKSVVGPVNRLASVLDGLDTMRNALRLFSDPLHGTPEQREAAVALMAQINIAIAALVWPRASDEKAQAAVRFVSDYGSFWNHISGREDVEVPSPVF